MNLTRTALLLLGMTPLVSCAARGRAGSGASPSAPAKRFVVLETAAGRLRVSDGGAGGTPVIFVHGLGGDLEVWRAQLDHLRVGRRGVAYDQRGHGQSDKARDGVYTIEALADDLEAVRKGLGLGKVILVGHSMAGAVLTTYAGRHPEVVEGLVYVDAFGDARAFPREEVAKVVARETSPSFGPAERRAVFEEMLAPARPATREQVLSSLAVMDAPAFGLLRKGVFELVDAPARYAAYRGPAVAVEVGDQAFPAGAAAVLGIRRVAVQGVSHWAQLDDPGALNREIDAFLAGLPAGR